MEPWKKDFFRVIERTDKVRYNNQPVFVTGNFRAEEIFDKEVGVTWPGHVQVLRVERTVQVYQFIENVIKKETVVGPNAIRTTEVHEYDGEWRDEHVPSGHYKNEMYSGNKKPDIESKVYQPKLFIDNVEIDKAYATELIKKNGRKWRMVNGHFKFPKNFSGEWSRLDNDTIQRKAIEFKDCTGDLRITYKAWYVTKGSLTVPGTLKGNTLHKGYLQPKIKQKYKKPGSYIYASPGLATFAKIIFSGIFGVSGGICLYLSQ
jgi:hypothetical protein